MYLPLDDKRVYVFVRTDIPFSCQFVHYGHAILMAVKTFKDAFAPAGDPHIIVVKVKNANQLVKAANELYSHDIAYIGYSDEDHPELGITTIATVPLDNTQRNYLKRYRILELPERLPAENLSVQL